ncbi:hypothetical protein CGCTS75_v005051 [Colletotrichum tropicale]|nr:hypothetical protein CGCTS75_v005051 [Colletotrichum tropicale]
MAEVFGVVASALAVAELTGKFGVSIVKLKKLWDEIQDVPEEMNRIMRRLEILKPVLAEMEAEFVQQRHKVYHNSAASLSIEYCRQAVDDLESLAEDLQARISAAKRTRRNLTRLKVSFKKEAIREYQERIGFALQLISLSQQTYIVAVVKSQPVAERVKDPKTRSLSTSAGDAQEVQTATSLSYTSSVYGSRRGYLKESSIFRHIVLTLAGKFVLNHGSGDPTILQRSVPPDVATSWVLRSSWSGEKHPCSIVTRWEEHYFIMQLMEAV